MATLFDPLNVAQMTMKNRIVMPPIATELSDSRGQVTDALVTYYRQRAAGVGLVIVEHAYVAPEGKKSPRQLGIHDDALLKGLMSLADSIHGEGTPVCIQIDHAGGEADSSISGCQAVCPSAVTDKISARPPRELKKPEIEQVVTLFAEATLRARAAGFDAVEVQGGEGYLLSQFTSPLSNKRTDDYGCTFEGRMRFPIQVVKAIREALGPKFPVLYRLDEGQRHDLTIGQSQYFAKRLVEAGVSLVNVSTVLIRNSFVESTAQEYTLSLARKIKEVVNTPVGFAVTSDPEFADEAIKTGNIDLAGIGMFSNNKYLQICDFGCRVQTAFRLETCQYMDNNKNE